MVKRQVGDNRSPILPLFDWLRLHGWPIPDGNLNDLTFEHPVAEIGMLRNEAAYVNTLYQLRPLPGFPRVVFVINASHQDKMSRSALRRIAAHFAARPRSGSSRNQFELERMIFLSVCRNNTLSIFHLVGESALLAKMATNGPYYLANADYCEEMAWDCICDAGVPFDEEIYDRFERARPRGRCTREFVDRYAPDYAPLFKLATKAGSISQSEEDLLFLRMRAGNQKALERIVQLNLSDVFDRTYWLIRTYNACRPSFDDVFSGAMDGLMSAIQDYDFSRSNRFASFSWQRIHQNALRGLVNGLYPIRVPVYVWYEIASEVRELSEETEYDFVDNLPAKWDRRVETQGKTLLMRLLLHHPITGVPTNHTQRQIDNETDGRIRDWGAPLGETNS